jgi:hypothetical protein
MKWAQDDEGRLLVLGCTDLSDNAKIAASCGPHGMQISCEAAVALVQAVDLPNGSKLQDDEGKLLVLGCTQLQ